MTTKTQPSPTELQKAIERLKAWAKCDGVLFDANSKPSPKSDFELVLSASERVQELEKRAFSVFAEKSDLEIQVKDLESKLEKCEKERDELSAQNLKMRQRNLLNAVDRICQTCGHEKTQDGCPNCMLGKYSEEHSTFMGIVQTFELNLSEMSPNETYRFFYDLKQELDSLHSLHTLTQTLVSALKVYAKEDMWTEHVINSYTGLCWFFDWDGDLQDKPFEVATKALLAAKQQGIE